MRKYHLYLYLILIIIVFPACSSMKENDVQKVSEPLDKEVYIQKVNSILTEQYEDNKFNGTIIVGIDGEILYNKAFGISNYQTLEELDTNSQFKIASITKQFTAMAVMILQERGTLNYDDAVQDYLVDFPYADITIRNLLTHTSGLPEYTFLWSYKNEKPIDIEIPKNEDLLNWLVESKKSLLFSPGTKFQYNNTGYAVLASIIEKTTGVKYDQFLLDNIFGPINMENTLVVYRGEEDAVPNRAYGYSIYKPVGGNETYQSRDYWALGSIVGDSGIYSTTEDLYKWDQALYTEKLVNQVTLDEAFSPFVLPDGSSTGYGFGWVVNEDEQNKMVHHFGGVNGFRSLIFRNTAVKAVLIVLCNNSVLFEERILEEIISL